MAKTIGQLVIEYHRLHPTWRMFPLKRDTKSDHYLEHGCNDASCDPIVLVKWWRNWHDANIGLALDENFVIDVDYEGRDTWARLIAEHGEPNATLQVNTPDSGMHYHFENSRRFGNPKLCDKWPGIDVKGIGGYVLLPPSRAWTFKRDEKGEFILDENEQKIRDKLGHYLWVNERTPIARANDWIESAVQSLNGAHGRKTISIPADSKPIPVKSKPGQGHYDVRDLAASLRVAMSRATREIPENIQQELLEVAVRKYHDENLDPSSRDPNYSKMDTLVEQTMENIRPDGHFPTDDDVPPEDHHGAGGRRAGEYQPEQEKPKAGKARLVGEILSMDIAPNEMLVEDLIPHRGLSTIIAPAKAGKTIFSAQTAIAVATGTALFQWYKIHKPGPVIVIEVDDRRATASFQNIYRKTQLAGNVPIYLFDRESWPFELGAEMIAALEEQIDEIHPVMIVLDSYTALRSKRRGAGDIVKTEEEEYAALDALAARKDVAILLVHHVSNTNKAHGDRLDFHEQGAGTYALQAACESIISLARFPDDGPDSPLRLLRVRGRHFKEAQAAISYVEAVESFELKVSGPGAPSYRVWCDIGIHIEEPTFTPKGLATALSISAASAHRHISQMLNGGLISKIRYGEYHRNQGPR